MNKVSPGMHRPLAALKCWWAPAFVLGVTGMLTLVTTYSAYYFTEARERVRFESAVEQTRQNIRRLLKGYLTLLEGTRGLVDAKVSLNRSQFYAYVESLQLQKNYPGIQGQGFVLKLTQERLAAFLDKVKIDGSPGFQIKPDASLKTIFPVVYLAPHNDRNDLDIGFDMSSEPMRMDAIRRAMESGQPSISDRVPPLSKEHPAENRFLIFLPVYWDGAVPATPELRLQKAMGCVYCPFQLDEFFGSLLDTLLDESVEFQVYAGEDTGTASLLHDSSHGQTAKEKPKFLSSSTLAVADRTWRLEFSTRPEFTHGSAMLAPLTFAGGAAISLLLFMITLTQVKTRTAAEKHSAALRESEEEFRASFYSAAVGKAQVDPVTGRYLRVNSRFCEIAGRPEEELQQMTYLDLTHPEDRASDQAAHELMTGGELPDISREKRYVKKDGRVNWVNVSTSMIRDSEGRPLRTLAVVQDITARKEAEEALRGAEARFRSLVEQSIAGIYVIQEGKFTYINPKMAAIFGYDSGELAALPVDTVILAEDRGLVAENIRRRLTGSVESLQYFFRGVRRGGEVIDVEVHGSRVEYNGRPAILGMLQDVTERKRGEARAAWLASFPERNPNPIVELDLKNGFVHYINPAAQKLFPDLEKEGGEHSFLAHLQDMPSVPVEEDSGAMRREVVVGERTFSQTLNYVPENERLRVYGTDITARRRAEQELITLNMELEQRVQDRTALLEEANKELESFSYSVSHDLRAPLRHIQGYVEMLTATTAGQLGEKAARYLRTITNASTEMGQLIDDLLAFSRMGRVGLNREKVELAALVQEVVRSVERTAKVRTIEWRIGELQPVRGDTAMLKQVLANLLDNAVKYTRPRDVAVIEVGQEGEEEGGAVFYVRDNGAGFDMKYVHKLFGVFQRLHRADEFEGTGIGLATVRRIIARHGGKTWAESELNRGSTFYFTLQTVSEIQPPTLDLPECSL